MNTTGTVTRKQAEQVLAEIRKQFTVHCATHAEIAERNPDDPDFVRLLTCRPDGTPRHENPQPKLVENWEWVSGTPVRWAILWEEGPCEWAYIAMHGGTDADGFTIPAATPVEGVYTEAWTTWAIGIYPT